MLNSDPDGLHYTFDWPGTGRSKRISVNFRDPKHVRDFYTEALESWRSATLGDAPKMHLLGHSFGGYLSVGYCAAYPSRVARLTLLSPIGIASAPPDVGLVSENTQPKSKVVLRILETAWEAGYAPLSCVRATGPLGRNCVTWWVKRRVAHLAGPEPRADDGQQQDGDSPDDPRRVPVDLLLELIYRMARQGAGCDGAITKVIDKSMYAREPMAGDVASILSTHGVAVQFVYGVDDWMDTRTAESLAQEHSTACNTKHLPHCGHLLILEAPRAVAKAVGSFHTRTTPSTTETTTSGTTP
eukprot:Selendium_serpulae@DN5632_c0_g1_i2.p1